MSSRSIHTFIRKGYIFPMTAKFANYKVRVRWEKKHPGMGVDNAAFGTPHPARPDMLDKTS